MHNFKELKVWQKAIDLAVDVYKATESFPIHERYGLTSQIKRCTVSISSNIAEGSGRGSAPQLKHFLTISLGSAFELETQLIIARRLEMLDDENAEKLIGQIAEIQKMLYVLEKSVKA